jgi:hypothetical protein
VRERDLRHSPQCYDRFSANNKRASVGSVGFEPIILVGSVVVTFKDFEAGPSGLHPCI